MQLFRNPLLSAGFVALFASRLLAGENAGPSIAEYNFTSAKSSAESQSGTDLPRWAGPVKSKGGEFDKERGVWTAPRTLGVGEGQLSIDLDRAILQQDLALSLTYEAGEDADVSVQLLDESEKTVAVDLFQNVVALGKNARTDTFIVPLRKYPTARKLSIRRVAGDVKIHGFVAYPVAGEIQSDVQSHAEFAKLFGDPLSEKNSLADALADYAPKDRDEADKLKRTLSSIPGAPAIDFRRVETAKGGVVLSSKEGERFCGHQMDFFKVSTDGSFGCDKPAWINLYHTEDKSFRISGEVMLAEGTGPWAHTDSPDGFAIFLREFSSLRRYNANSRGMRVKRRLLEGEMLDRFARPFEFKPLQHGKWYTFSAEARPDLISFSLGGQMGMIRGPLETDGANKILLTPGAKLRNLKLTVFP